MKKNLHIASIFLAILFTGCQCKKSVEAPQLPPITQTGANTFGCKINGQVWVPYWPCVDLVAGATELDYNIEPIYNISSLPIYFSLNAGNINNGNSFFSFQQNYTFSNHIYTTGNIYDSVLIQYFGNPGNDYMNYPAQLGDTAARYLQITKLDTVNKIISGIFAFTLYARVGVNSIDSIIVTEGRFDLQIRQYARCSN